MASEDKLRRAFAQIKSDMTLLNGEITLVHERIAKLESILIRESVKGTLDMMNIKPIKKKKKAKKSAKKKSSKKKK